VNGVDGIFKTSTCCEKTIIWNLKFKIGTLIKEKYNRCYNNNIGSKWTPIEFIIKDIPIGKS
jgi:hypothetical protein